MVHIFSGRVGSRTRMGECEDEEHATTAGLAWILQIFLSWLWMFVGQEIVHADRPCRIAVVGLNRQRVQKVIALIDDEQLQSVEFIPCVAQFDSYETEDGVSTRYLVNLRAFEREGAESRSLLPLFDAAAEYNSDTYPPIAGVALGVGIEGEADTELIRGFLSTVMRFPDEETKILVDTIQPSGDFTTMAEELKWYRNLSDEDKAIASNQGRMGPGKMAAFVSKFTLQVMRDYGKGNSAPIDHSSAHPENTPQIRDSAAQAQIEEVDHIEETVVIDHEKPMYLCRKCRTVLFGIDSLNKHVPSKHSFSYRKQHNSTNNTSDCQSLFLGGTLPWMGDTNANEGKFGCPKCNTKLGTWNWSGAQCSCGTWVVPAIQIPTSRVDTYCSPTTNLPPGAVLSALLLQHSPTCNSAS